MRIVENRQMKIGQFRVENIKIDERERDEIPQLLRGLQKIYCNPDLKKKIFSLLTEMLPKNVNVNIGLPGMDLWMDLWKVLIISTIKLMLLQIAKYCE